MITYAIFGINYKCLDHLFHVVRLGTFDHLPTLGRRDLYYEL
jgi:hypothetical protein